MSANTQYREQVERWWSPEARTEMQRILCNIAPCLHEDGRELSPLEQIEWLESQIARLTERCAALEDEQDALQSAASDERARCLEVAEHYANDPDPNHTACEAAWEIHDKIQQGRPTARNIGEEQKSG